MIVEPYLIDNSSPRPTSDEMQYDIQYQESNIPFDHPLSVKKDSMWNKFFKDMELWEEIEKDVRRTRSDMTFFIDAVDKNKNVDQEQLKK